MPSGIAAGDNAAVAHNLAMIHDPSGIAPQGSSMRFTVAALALPLLLSSYDTTRADECSELWFRRNQIYKDAGYCFKTSRAIAAFGNAGCQYDELRDVPLSERGRGVVGRYVREEAALGCRP